MEASQGSKKKGGKGPGVRGDAPDTTTPTTILADPGHTRADIALIGRSVRERWAVPKVVQEETIKRLRDVVNKPACSAVAGDSVVMVDASADSNAVRAAAVLVQMTKINQDDEHLADKNSRLDTGKPTERIAMAPVVIEKPWAEQGGGDANG